VKSPAITARGEPRDSLFAHLLRYASGCSGWRLVPLFIAVLVLIPVGVVIASLLTPSGDVWRSKPRSRVCCSTACGWGSASARARRRWA
jgi:hypothetical protein